MAELPETINELAQQLKSQGVIKVFVGDETEPYMIQQILLERASDYFVKAIKNERMGKDNVGILRFPDGDKDVWKLLVGFIIYGTLPDDLDLIDNDGQILLIDCWILGDRYFLPDFQDLAMIKLLHTLSKANVEWDVMAYGFENTSTGSAIRKAVANEAMSTVYENGDPSEIVDDDWTDELERLAKAPGGVMDILAARVRFEQNGRKWVCPYPAEAGVTIPFGTSTWHEYMVSEPDVSSKSSAYLARLFAYDAEREQF